MTVDEILDNLRLDADEIDGIFVVTQDTDGEYAWVYSDMDIATLFGLMELAKMDIHRERQLH